MTFTLTTKQKEGNQVLASDSTHCMLFGGSRSGKTFLIMRAVILRALAHPSRHVVLRHRFNHLKASVIYDTFPKVMELCWPQKTYKLDKQDWFVTLPHPSGGKSEIWFGGLDEKERTEKILGSEFATIFFNECSQIHPSSRNMAITRLAQNTPLRLKAFYDCNPLGQGHWTYKLFIKKVDPDKGTGLADRDAYTSLQMNPEHNRDNLPQEYFKTLEALPERQRKRFLLGVFAQENESALWTPELLDFGRILDGETPELQRIVIAVDPSGCAGEEDIRSDEVGIVVVGLGVDGRGYVLEDLSGRFGPGGEDGWGSIVCNAYDRWGADGVVAETNFGGAMVKQVVRAVNATIPFKEVKASRGKIVRAEPIAALWDQDKARLYGRWPELEDQLMGMTTAGYIGTRSPDRADAMVWGFHQLFSKISRSDGKARSTPRVINSMRTMRLNQRPSVSAMR